MSSRRSARQLLVGAVVGVVLGGGLMALTPAGAEVSSAAATRWKKVWKKELRPLADKRYHTKEQSDAAYQPKGAYEPAGSGYTKAESDARYQPQGSYAPSGASYTKAESDARYAPAQPLYRGTYQLLGDTSSIYGDAHGISFGATFPAAPTPHYIRVGDALPAACAGSAAAPDAAPGHLCVFETRSLNAGTRGVCGSVESTCPGTDPWGAGIFTFPSSSAPFNVFGVWAARPSGPVVNPSFAPAPPGTVNAPSGKGAPPLR